MGSRATGWLSAIGFAAAGVGAAWLWVEIQSRPDSVGAAAAASVVDVQAPAAASKPAPPPEEAPALVEPPRPTRADSAPAKPTESWEGSVLAATDYFGLAQLAALSALAGDSRAQYVLGRVLFECGEELRPVLSMQSTSAADNLRAYLALIPGSEDRAIVVQRIRRCERFFDGSPLDGLSVPEDAHSSRYWLERAVASRDPLAVMDDAIEQSARQHWDSVPAEHRARLLADVRTAVASRAPAALFKVGTLYSQATVGRDAAQGAAWLVAACEAGYDCSNANPAIGQGCSERQGCDAGSTLPEMMRLTLGDAQFAEIRAAGDEILTRINRGDWEGLQPYLETK
jgi:hypothetical protein